MKIPFEQFERKFVRRAAELTKDSPDVEAAQNLLSEVYDGCDESDFSDERRINFLLAERYYSTCDQPTRSETERCARLIFGKDLEQPESWIPFATLQEKLSPILHNLPLIDRIVAAFLIVNWENPEIAQFLTSLMDLSGVSHKSISTFIDLHHHMVDFRKRLSASLTRLDGDSSWLTSLFEHGDLDGDFKTWQILRDLRKRPDAIRYAKFRGVYVDKYKVLRNRWRAAKEHIQGSIRREDLFAHGASEGNNG